MKISLKEFKGNTKKVKEKRCFKVSGSNGVKQAFFYYRKNRKKEKKYVLTSTQYYETLRRINAEIIKELLDGSLIKLPENMGELSLISYSPKFVIRGGELKTNLPIDWDKTMELWYEDEESFLNKTLIYRESKILYKVKYSKWRAMYINKSFYRFTPHRTFLIKLNERKETTGLNTFTTKWNKG